MLVGASFLIATLPLGIGIYQQEADGIPWGEDPTDTTTLTFLLAFIVLCAFIGGAIVFLTKLDIRIANDGVHFRFFPTQIKWRLIQRDEIESYELKKLQWYDTGRLGRLKSRLSGRKVYKTFGSSVVLIKLRSGEQIMLGTGNPEGIGWALKRMLNKQETL